MTHGLLIIVASREFPTPEIGFPKGYEVIRLISDPILDLGSRQGLNIYIIYILIIE